MARTIVIGDVHGCLDELKRLLDKLDYDPREDDLNLLGDLIDRGPDSPGVVDFLMQLELEALEYKHEANSVLGNHEDMLFDYLKGNGELINGLELTIEQYGMKPFGNISERLQQHLPWLQRLPLFIQKPGMVLVHAGWTEQAAHIQATSPIWFREMCLWERRWEHHYKDDTIVLYGHTPVKAPLLGYTKAGAINSINLDTGAVYGHELSGAWFNQDSEDSTIHLESVHSKYTYDRATNRRRSRNR